MVLYEDTLNKAGKHKIKNDWWAAHGVEVVRTRLDSRDSRAPVDFGDYYTNGSNRVVDTKKDIAELAMCVSKDHKRFKHELMRAQAAGYRLVILTENTEGVHSVSDLERWENTHCHYCGFRYTTCNPLERGGCIKHHTRNKPIGGLRFARTVKTMERKYMARFLFCTPEQSAAMICELLGIEVSHANGK